METTQHTAEAIRKVTLLDLLILVGATCAGLGLVRYYVASPTGLIPTFNQVGTLSLVPSYRGLDRQSWATIGALLLAGWSPALLLMRLTGRRARTSELTRRPSLWIGIVATLVVLAFFGQHLLTIAFEGWPTFAIPAVSHGRLIQGQLDFFALDVLPKLKGWLGPAMAVTVSVSAAFCLRRRAIDWVDRAGLALGGAWILVYLA